MKKTMFITSVIMVVVMAIALTTSSLAWFTASSSVSVGTNAVTISAKSQASEGLLITKDITSAAWSSGTIDLGTTASTNLRPVVPSTDDATTLTAASLIEALGNEWFIGNTTKTESSTLLWEGTPYGSTYEEDPTDSDVAAVTCWYSDDLYVANAGDKAVHIQADVAFNNRHGATLFVAVMAQKASDSKWELIRLESSTSNEGVAVTSLQTGRGEDYFAEDEQVSLAYDGVNPGTLGNTSETLAGKETGAAWGGTKHFKVIAWYSVDLYNGNSGAYDADDNTTGTSNDFTVTFSIPSGDLLSSGS